MDDVTDNQPPEESSPSDELDVAREWVLSDALLNDPLDDFDDDLLDDDLGEDEGQAWRPTREQWEELQADLREAKGRFLARQERSQQRELNPWSDDFGDNLRDPGERAVPARGDPDQRASPTTSSSVAGRFSLAARARSASATATRPSWHRERRPSRGGRPPKQRG